MGETPGYNPESEAGIEAQKAMQSNIKPVSEIPGRSFLETPLSLKTSAPNRPPIKMAGPVAG
ncbi:MAG: hypothetical protein COT25_00075 [Candidatus Kerfeldbacteria bacterium CG08_land_8_20_14_0_20_42_7]|uniref:Uncharacterized protein n=1 Tax=Candidatus Kerfeldbacteria bacterium CG08_land_8_20_14_0_20_42_7 TaxID=2014245 RepID=A0A2H0YU39_9BACT|nr:MAG: hypothetical protein COT25_00075 [Candidatus Kerfeldbacteria bacterium CG08_land_8_20_14_0_20_42_7]